MRIVRCRDAQTVSISASVALAQPYSLGHRYQFYGLQQVELLRFLPESLLCKDRLPVPLSPLFLIFPDPLDVMLQHEFAKPEQLDGVKVVGNDRSDLGGIPQVQDEGL